MSGPDLAYGSEQSRCESTARRLRSATRLRACSSMSGTAIAYGGTRLRAPYKMSGTEIAYAATPTGGSSKSESG
eukprot:3330426-Rhodomonas_salina.5